MSSKLGSTPGNGTFTVICNHSMPNLRANPFKTLRTTVMTMHWKNRKARSENVLPNQLVEDGSESAVRLVTYWGKHNFNGIPEPFFLRQSAELSCISHAWGGAEKPFWYLWRKLSEVYDSYECLLCTQHCPSVHLWYSWSTRCLWMLENSNISLVFVQARKVVAPLLALSRSLGQVKTVVSFTEITIA